MKALRSFLLRKITNVITAKEIISQETKIVKLSKKKEKNLTNQHDGYFKYECQWNKNLLYKC